MVRLPWYSPRRRRVPVANSWKRLPSKRASTDALHCRCTTTISRPSRQPPSLLPDCRLSLFAILFSASLLVSSAFSTFRQSGNSPTFHLHDSLSSLLLRPLTSQTRRKLSIHSRTSQRLPTSPRHLPTLHLAPLPMHLSSPTPKSWVSVSTRLPLGSPTTQSIDSSCSLKSRLL